MASTLGTFRTLGRAIVLLFQPDIRNTRRRLGAAISCPSRWVTGRLGIPKIAEHEQGTWSSAWTDFTNLNVLDRRPSTTHLHLCFYARSKEQVDAFHRAGVEAGFRSNGAPGYRDVGNIGHGESAELH